MLRIFDGGIPDRVLGRGSTIALFPVFIHTQKIVSRLCTYKIKKFYKIKKPRLLTPANNTKCSIYIIHEFSIKH